MTHLPPEVNSEIIVAPNGTGEPWFCSEIGFGNEVWYTIKLFPVFEHENRLNSGRFLHFTKTKQEDEVSLRMKFNYPHSNFFGSFHAKIQKLVEWCHMQCEDLGGNWSVDLLPHTVHDIEFIFSFDNPIIAVSFKMVWS